MQVFGKVLIVAVGLMLAGCAQDPSIYDLKSPCVDSGQGENSPCVTRSSLENIVV